MMLIITVPVQPAYSDSVFTTCTVSGRAGIGERISFRPELIVIENGYTL